MTSVLIFDLVSIGKKVFIPLFIFIMVVPLPAMFLRGSFIYLYNRFTNKMRYKRVKRCFIEVANLNNDQVETIFSNKDSDELHSMIRTFRDVETDEY